MLFKPLSIKFYKYDVNEYCKDSKSYYEDLDLWKKTLKTKLFEQPKNTYSRCRWTRLIP